MDTHAYYLIVVAFPKQQWLCKHTICTACLICWFCTYELVAFPVCFVLSFSRSLFLQFVDGERQNSSCLICGNVELNLFQHFFGVCSSNSSGYVQGFCLEIFIRHLGSYWCYVESFSGTLVLI